MSIFATAGIYIAPQRSASSKSACLNTAEQRHFHQRTTQFFYVLAGELIFELDGEEHRLPSSTGLTVPAQMPHQVFNRGREDARLLVISQPPSHEDRVPAAL